LVSYGLAGALALALLLGACVERVRWEFCLCAGLVWLCFIFYSGAQWLGDAGWLTNLGALDFAGGAVIHISAGVGALVTALVIGPRRGFGRIEMKPNHLPLTACGAALLWVGWCGLVAGRGRAPMAVATGALVAMQISAAGAALSWMAVEWLQRDKPTMLGTFSGAVSGLVGITAGAGYVSPLSALVIGIGAGGLCYMVVNFVKPILRYDDSLDVFGIHAVGGTWGMIATGLFASTAANPGGGDGLFFGYPYLFFAQLTAVLAMWGLAAGGTYVLLKALRFALDPRVDAEQELMGLDLAVHGEKGYS
jgi:Amt family ammonium transporter